MAPSAQVTKTEDLAKEKAKFFGLAYVDLSAVRIDPAVLAIIPKNVAENYQVLAFERDAATLSVALVDPKNSQAQQALEVLGSQLNLRIRYYVTTAAGFQTAFNQYGLLKREVSEVIEVAKREFAQTGKQKEALEITEEAIKGAPVSRIVSTVMRQAAEANASDIHIEPHGEGARVRYRVDGTLKTALTLPRALQGPVISRIKVLANLKLDETRVPQDGRITEEISGHKVDFRVSTLPLQEGQEKAVLRLLPSTAPPRLEDLGYRAEHIALVAQNIKKPHGIIMISGPTGAGKSTTLYAVLAMLNAEGVNIVTLEDPIEYFISGVNQSQIRPEVGFSFASGLRALLRQDPNVIMVGEIRDGETAELAIHAALTGHLILTTIHTNDALGIVPRLLDMKVEPFLLGATFNLGIAQRLARRVCQDCKVSAELPASVVEQMRAELKKVPAKFLPKDAKVDSLQFFKGKGCARCGDRGYKGRVAVVEILQATPSLEKLISSGQWKPEELAKEIMSQEMITIKQDALLKALAGLTTVEEVLRISQE